MVTSFAPSNTSPRRRKLIVGIQRRNVINSWDRVAVRIPIGDLDETCRLLHRQDQDGSHVEVLTVPPTAVQYAAMTQSENAPNGIFQKHRRTLGIVLVVGSLLGTAVTFFVYKRYADVWLKRPPRMSSCVMISRRLLSHEETVSGSIPHMAPDGTMVYLRPTEDRAVTCMSRYSPRTASFLAAAFAEADPDKRARALAAILRDHVSTDASADSEALAAYLITTAALRPLPKTQEIEDLRHELEQRNGCRFDMQRPCPIRPPMPVLVWILGPPSLIGLVVSLGWGAAQLTTRMRVWWDKQRTKKKSVKKNESDESPKP